MVHYLHTWVYLQAQKITKLLIKYWLVNICVIGVIRVKLQYIYHFSYINYSFQINSNKNTGFCFFKTNIFLLFEIYYSGKVGVEALGDN